MNLKNNSIELLSWDTDFFGFKVAKISSEAAATDWPEIFNTLYSENIQLAYFFSPAVITKPDNDLFEILLADKKVTYQKKISSTENTDAAITTYWQDYPEKKLETLAVESGICSRFNTDSRIGRQKFEELYRLWILHSVQKKIALEVLVFAEDETINGMVTLGEKNNRADIGIIAVDANERGKGIGRSLMFAAENWFVAHDYTDMQVVTQGDNTAACRLYESCGFSVERTAYVYHIWRN